MKKVSGRVKKKGGKCASMKLIEMLANTPSSHYYKQIFIFRFIQ